MCKGFGMQLKISYICVKYEHNDVQAVDDYLAYCEDEGIEPDKSYTGVLNVRLTPAIHRQIAMLAIQAGKSINAYIKDALEEKLEAVPA